MISKEQGQKLHLKYALGEAISKEELDLLKEWYAYHDGEEAKVLKESSEKYTINNNVDSEIDKTFEELKNAIEQLQQIRNENEKLRLENENIKKRIAQISNKKRA